MHLEICVEDQSGKILLEHIIPKAIKDDVTFRIHAYKGIGHIPKNLSNTNNPSHRILLDNLPKLIRGCANTPYVSALIVVADTDDKDCEEFLDELRLVHQEISPTATVIFRLAIEEMEAWLLGDPTAIKTAYPNADDSVINGYVQDSVCGTWEWLANAIHPGGAEELKTRGWPASGIAKCEWADSIGSKMNLDVNKSTSFNKFLESLRPYRI